MAFTSQLGIPESHAGNEILGGGVAAPAGAGATSQPGGDLRGDRERVAPRQGRGRTDDQILQEIRTRYDYAQSAWSPIVDEGDTDMRYVSGDPWDPIERKEREDANRPCLALDEIGQYTNQVINNVLANPRAMKFAPTGNGANDQGAQFYASKARETEYRSHAQLAYTTAHQNAVERSFGWVRVTTRESSDRSFNQDLWIEDIPNPNMVLPDPDFKRPDGSDLRYLFYVEPTPIREFKITWPHAAIQDFTLELRTLAPSWVNGDRQTVKVAEYWTKELVRMRRLLLIKRADRRGPLEIFEDELAPGALATLSELILREREVPEHEVTQYMTNGVEILKTTAWKGKYIPFASCLGKVIYVDTGSGPKRQILSMVRLARDPVMAHAYGWTTEAEIVGGIPKFPYFVYEGQLTPKELDLLARSTREPVAVITLKPVVDGATQQVLPPPVRQSWDPALAGIEQFKESARRAIQSAIMGSPLPTEAQRHNEKSGIALKQIEKSGQIGSFHFNAHYDDLIRHVGVIFEDLLDKILDTARDTGIRDADGTAKIVRVNDPKPDAKHYPDNVAHDQALQAWKGRLPSGCEDSVDTKGDYLVTVSSGPAVDSEREAVNEFVQSLMQIPVVAAQCADLIVRLQAATMGFGQLSPLLDELADRITPPQFRKPKDGEGPDPQQLRQQLAQGQQEVGQLKEMLQKLSQEILTKKAETESRERIAAADIQSKEKLAALDRETKLGVAELGAKVDRLTLFMEERGRVGAQLADAHQADLDRAHAVGLAGMGQAHALEQGDQGHAQALEQSDQGHAQALEQGQQAADLAPPADAGADA